MPEEDIAVPGVGRRLLIFIVTLFMGTWPTACQLQNNQKSTGRRPAGFKTIQKSPADRLPAHHAIDPIGHAVIERIGKYAFGFVAINLRKMCSFLKRSVYL